MKRRPSGSKGAPKGHIMPISKAIVGFLNHKYAEGMADRTIESYEHQLNKWVENTQDKAIDQVSPEDIREYLAWLRTDYIPVRMNCQTHPLSPKTIHNVQVTLASFFKWAHQEFGIPNPMVDIPATKFQVAPVEVFTKEEVEKLLKACAYTREADTKFRRSYTYTRPTAQRDRAIILTLVDTGVRALELCSLLVQDVNLKTGRVEVKHGFRGGAKGGKGRTVFLGKAARRAVWRYLANREDGNDPEAPLFLGKGERLMTPNGLRQLIKKLADKAGVDDAYPYKFRHTFAITYLRSGGDTFTLQALLGHSTLDMVRHYARIAQVDVQQAHRKASPVDNWRL